MQQCFVDPKDPKAPLRVGKRLWAIIEEQIVLDQDVEGNKGAGGSDEGSTLSERTAHKSTSTGQSD